MYEFLRNMWILGKIDETDLQTMVAKNFITQQEYEQIILLPKQGAGKNVI